MTPQTTIQIYSDVVCPWCWVGKRRLERALAQLEPAQTQVIWRPFQLNPTMPKEGKDRTTYLERKFGSLDVWNRLQEQVVEAGAAEGIAFAFHAITRTPNTLLAHRLIWHAERQGVQDALVETLFRGYFEGGADLGSRATLVDLARRAGLDSHEADRFLKSEEGMTEVRAQEASGHARDIRGVPYFDIDGTRVIQGAQSAEAFVAAIHQARFQKAAVATRR